MKRLVFLFLFLTNISFALTDLIDLAENATELKEVVEVNSEVRQQLDFYFGNRVFFLTQKGSLELKTNPYKHTYFWYKWCEFRECESDFEKLLIFEEILN